MITFYPKTIIMVKKIEMLEMLQWAYTYNSISMMEILQVILVF